MLVRKKPYSIREEVPIVEHKGIFKRQLSFFQTIALIVSGTVGAGILGIPYAVSKVGVGVGMIYIVCVGSLMIGLNLMVGEIVVRTREKLHLVGLARKYLGWFGEVLMTIFVYLTLLGVLVVFTIGEGEVLAELFGGSNFMWSIVFFVIANFLIIVGFNTVKTVEFFLSLGILVIIIIMAFYSAPHIDFNNATYHNLAYLFFPYGVILFAYSSSAVVVEAHSVLKDRDLSYKKAIIIAGFIVMAIYALFAIVAVGVTGPETTEVATVGLGRVVGKSMLFFGNIFAIIAMGTTFLIMGTALKDSLTWDYKLPKYVSLSIVIFVPFIVFLFGVRHFIQAVDIVGGVFMSIAMLLQVLIYWRAKQLGHLKKSRYKLHHTFLLIALLMLALSAGAIYSVVKLF
ncbi:hypothetical protein HOF40_04150 [Candidatus Parcubacteria bacterium]|jgi:tyrosine-specific transport protein|nr:hypothetical protein [Candidatus Parcubacteria bacterium]MBT3949254.1 hypothetical protein [Candidatus Parcubacteria bacterium]